MRDCPCVSINPQPSRSPAAAETTIAVSFNEEWAVTKVKKFCEYGFVAITPNAVPIMIALNKS